MPLKVLLSLNAFNVPCSDKTIIIIKNASTGYCKFAIRSDFNTFKSVIFNLSKCGTKWVITGHSLFLFF